MASELSNHTALTTLGGIRKEIITRANNPTSNRGCFYVEGTMAVTMTGYNTAGDFVGVVQLPDNCRLLGGWISTDTELDAHVTPAGRWDLAIADTTPTVTHTLTNASALLNIDDEVLSWGGSATFAENEYPGIDVSNKWFGLVTDTPASTISGAVTLSFGVYVYLGAAIDLGAG